MSRFTSKEATEYRAIRAACYQGLSTTELLTLINGRLQHLIGLDAFCSNLIDPTTTLITGAITEGWPDEAKVLLVERVLYQSHVADPGRLFKSGRRVVEVDDWLSDLDHPYEDSYFEYHLLPFNYRYEVILPCSIRGSPQVLMTLTREKRSGRFEGRHMNFSAAIAPHVAQGLARASIREMLYFGHSPSIGFIVMSEAGKVELANAAAEEWLSADNRHHWPIGLPLFLAVVARHLQRHDSPLQWTTLEMAHPKTGAPYRFHWELQVSDDGRPHTVVLIEPLQLADSPGALKRMGLTPREIDTALALLRGLTVNEIAVQMQRSSHTVTQHMKALFLKLGVSSRSELAARLMGR